MLKRKKPIFVQTPQSFYAYAIFFLFLSPKHVAVWINIFSIQSNFHRNCPSFIHDNETQTYQPIFNSTRWQHISKCLAELKAESNSQQKQDDCQKENDDIQIHIANSLSLSNFPSIKSCSCLGKWAWFIKTFNTYWVWCIIWFNYYISISRIASWHRKYW